MGNDQKKPFRIDIKNIFKSKNPKIATILPWFVFNYVKKIVHQDFINEFLDKHGDKKGLDFIRAVIEDFNVTIDIRGEENIPTGGKYIFAANHPLGGFDGLLLIYILSQRDLEVKFLVNDILLNIKNLKIFLFQ